MFNVVWNRYYSDEDRPIKNDISELIGETLVCVQGLEKDSEEVVFITTSGKAIKLYHEQNCCENVSVEDVDCDVEDFNGAKVVSAEVVSESGEETDYESVTWTFYKFETSRGGIWLRWFGESNGYYSEAVDVVGGLVK